MRKLFALFALLASALVVAPGAAAGDTPCVSTLLPGTYDNVVVPPGQTCILNSVTVLGNVKALQDSRLRINSSNVGGNVEGDKADIVQVDASTVRENITIKEGGPAVAPAAGFHFCTQFSPPSSTPCEAVVINSTIEDGNIQIEKMQGDTVVRANGLLSLSPIRGNIQIYETFVAAAEFLSIDGNSVSQNVQVFKNGGPGRKLVVFNTVRENLQCFENVPPFVGSANIARQAQGQCSAAPLPMALATFEAELPAIVD